MGAPLPRIRRGLDRLTAHPAFGDATIGGFCLAVILLAFVMTGDTDQVAIFGFDVPVLCTWRRLTGWPCPGCGLTRSFVLLAHGHLVEAFRANVLGPAVFLLVAAQVPLSTRRLIRLAR